MKLLVANRGEIALRVLRAAHERGAPTVAVFAADESGAPHVSLAGEAVALGRSGPAAYLDGAGIVAAALGTGCTHVHPGYGFLSEDPAFARACGDAGLAFVGPLPAVLEVFGDKVRAREAAVGAGLPVLDATAGDASADDVARFLADHPDGVMIKAQTAGGGRGLRAVRSAAEVEAAHGRCVAEATGWGRPSVFAEELLSGARHIEIQVVAAPDGNGGGVRAVAVGDRDCSVQRNLQKLVEVAPAQDLDDRLRRDLHAAAVTVCSAVGLTGLGTVELLVSGERFVFLEVNPRLQVEHTVTEEVTGLDLVGVALAVAGGAWFAELGLAPGVTSWRGGRAEGDVARAVGIAVQCRLNAETVDAGGRVTPGTGTVRSFVAPTGRGVRVETHARPGLVVTGRYDSLLAKIVTRTDTESFPVAVAKSAAALRETVLDGVPVNLPLLLAIVEDPELRAGPVTTTWLADALPRLAAASDGVAMTGRRSSGGPGDADVTVDGAQTPGTPGIGASAPALEDGESAVAVHLLGTVVALAEPGTVVAAGGDLAVLEAMKMHHSGWQPRRWWSGGCSPPWGTPSTPATSS